MSDLSVGAVGAAVIAGLISLLGLIIGKEQKVSEFRQSWIDELRKCMIAYLAHINAISDAIRLRASGQSSDNGGLIKSYQLLNEASHGISLRVNANEAPAKALLASMEEFESLAQDNSNLTPAKIKEAEKKFVEAAKSLLKFEWKRVKRGEGVFVWTKRIVIVVTVIMLAILTYRLTLGSSPENQPKEEPGFRKIAALSPDRLC